jgi:hypothetical protein
MKTHDPLQCTYEDARRWQLQRGIALSTDAKVAFFEEMVTFAFKFGARDRLENRGVARHSIRLNNDSTAAF